MAATRLSLRTNGRARADQDSSQFPTDAQYNVFIDRAAAAVWRKLVAAGWTPNRITNSITATGATGYPLAADFFSMMSVHFVGSDGRVELRRVKPENLPLLLSASPGQGTDYDLVGGVTSIMQIEFYPQPATGTYEVRYIPRFVGFSADGDAWNGPDGSDELVEIGAAIRGVMKEDGDPRALVAEFREIWDDVISGAHWANTPQTVKDVNVLTSLPFDWNVVDESI